MIIFSTPSPVARFEQRVNKFSDPEEKTGY